MFFIFSFTAIAHDDNCLEYPISKEISYCSTLNHMIKDVEEMLTLLEKEKPQSKFSVKENLDRLGLHTAILNLEAMKQFMIDYYKFDVSVCEKLSITMPPIQQFPRRP